MIALKTIITLLHMTETNYMKPKISNNSIGYPNISFTKKWLAIHYD